MTPERLAVACSHPRVSGGCDYCNRAAVDIIDAQAAHIRDLEAQLATARDLIRGITDTLEPYEGRLRVRGGWAEEFWGCIAEAEEHTRAIATPPSDVAGFGDLIGPTPSLPWPRWDATPPSPEVGE